MSTDPNARVALLEADLEQLKRRCAYLSLAVLGAVLLEAGSFVVFLRQKGAATLPTATGSGRVVWAQQFVLVDGAGNPCGVFHVNEKTLGPELSLLGLAGKGRIDLGIAGGLSDEPFLRMTDVKGVQRVGLHLHKYGYGSSLDMSDTSGHQTMTLFHHDLGGPHIQLRGSDGRMLEPVLR